MNYQTSKKGQRGQALILITLAAVGLFAFSALAIDGSRSYSNKRNAQNAADTSVLAAALAYIREPSTDTNVKFATAKTAAEKRAESNGFNPDTNPSVEVYIQRCNETTDLQTGATLVCEGIPSGADPAEFIRVRIVSTIPATFGRVIGRQTLTSAAEAIARVQDSSGSSTGGGFTGAAMVTTKGGNDPECFKLTGGADLHTHTSGIFVNCTNDRALFLNGDKTKFTTEAPSEVVGCVESPSGTAVVGTIKCKVNGQKSRPFDHTTYASVPTMPAPPSYCTDPSTTPGSTGGGTHLTPGLHAGGITLTKDAVIDPGTYCINSSFTNNGALTLSSAGAVTLVFMDASGALSGNGTFKFDSLTVFLKDGNFEIKNSLTANPLRVYSSGNSNVKVTSAGSTLKSENAYFYLHNGVPAWHGNAIIDLKAPPPSDSFKVGGLLFHMPWKSTDTTPRNVSMNGGTTIDLRGTFLMPFSDVTLNGQVGFELHSQIIAYKYTINGGGKIDIYYLASQNYNPPKVDDPTIQLTK